MKGRTFLCPNNLFFKMVISAAVVPAAIAGPDGCSTIGSTITCEGNQSQGISVPTTPPNDLQVLNLDRPIAPTVSGTPGISLTSDNNLNAWISSGESQQQAVIDTHGNNATGIVGIARGSSSSTAQDDAFLGVPLVGVNPAVAGGEVRINSFSDITTNGSGAHGIQGYSASLGYPESLLNRLESFSETGFSFTVTRVLNASGASVAFSGSSVQVRGHLIDASGVTLRDGNGNPIEHGTFTLYQDGHYDVQYSAAELAAHAALTQTESLSVAVDYSVLGSHDGQTQADDGQLIVTFIRNTAGSLVQTSEAWFDTFGVSSKPAATTSPTVFPDLKRYVTGLLNAASGGAAGKSVSIVSNGVLKTLGAESHGIHAYSQGGTGAGGIDGSIGHSAGGGSRGSDAGEVNLEANGSITTHLASSSGIVALSAGGAGGKGGDGGAWRWGQKGGTGGTGGTITVTGDATIKTDGNYSSGIIALSVGGNGGAGGSGSGAMPGGGGGFGGQGGRVIVDGSWDVTTLGDRAHGIWAKSLGGNAGSGGSGGWLFGDPGTGGTATDGGKVTLRSNGDIRTSGIYSYGLYAQSVGGFGGSGGTSWGLFWSFGGNGDSGGSGGEVEVFNLAGGSVTTNNLYSHGILAQSIGGGGGSGGGEFAVIASLGGTGAAGGKGALVTVENDGDITTGNAVAANHKGDYSHGIFAQSIGGGGGDGGGVSGLVSIGGAGSGTSDGGQVNVVNRGTINTYGIQSHAIFAQSIGGGGGNGGSSTGLVTIGGSGGGGGDADIVNATNGGTLHTHANESYGIFAQSIGGGGGSGGSAISIGAGVPIAIGGQGEVGGDGKAVNVTTLDDSQITTDGDRSHAIFAQSIGGGGGNGGFAISVGAEISATISIGGKGARGGDADDVTIKTAGEITTNGANAYGIFAQSIGGGGGSGGFAISASVESSGLTLSLGGTGGGGGIGKNVYIGTVDDPISGTIHTYGIGSHGIVAQSIGGAGGEGGFAISASIGSGSLGAGITAQVSVGGSGGSGNHGGIVSVQRAGDITTEAADAHAVLAQSIGGSGGAGGFSFSGNIGAGISPSVAIGGAGGGGSYGNTVNIGTEDSPTGGILTTKGDRSYGILAQSIGGSGGAAGTTVAGSLLGPAAMVFSFGRNGGSGGYGGEVNVYSGSSIFTEGEQSHGIFAQSIGGGGGAGGLSIAGGVSAFGGLSLSMGGNGGDGKYGGTVNVTNTGNIDTQGEYSYGIKAQSIGGGGGSGGASGSVMANFSSMIPIPDEYPTGSINISLSLGGSGGTGGTGGTVNVTNNGQITTEGDFSHGIFAQSVGGGGGDGGKSIAATANISMPEGASDEEVSKQLEVKVDFAMAIGGSGGSGQTGGAVTVNNHKTIETLGVGSHGIFAQSIGGGGGTGGDARSMILSIDPSNWQPDQPQPPDPMSISVGATLSVGGKGGSAANASTVSIFNYGHIATHGADAYGILAQSIGGGGGIGGGGYHGLDWKDFGVSEDYEQYLDLLPVQDEGDIHFTVGGSGGSSGDGKLVHVENNGNITTAGGGSIAVVAQSIGGGGGLAGVGAIGGDGEIGLGGSGGAAGDGGRVEVIINGNIDTSGVVAHGILAQSIGGGGGYAGNIDRGISDFGQNFALGGDGGSAGDGGEVTIGTTGNIITRGTGAVGILAQSIGGGGGLGGEVGFGFGFAGGVGGQGSGGKVTVSHEGDILTFGTAAHGIVAQSIGGTSGTIDGRIYGGLGQDVIVNSTGNIIISGENAHGIVAQSLGTAGNGSVTVNILAGSISGGSTSGSAVNVLNGSSNTVTNHGAISALSGRAIIGGSGAERIDNYGTISGDVDLGSGSNSFNNLSGALFNSLSTITVGSGLPLTNAGTLSPGGMGSPQVTTLTGNLIQSSTGSLAIDLSLAGHNSDRLEVAGSAQVGGSLKLNPIDTGLARTGTQRSVILNASDGANSSGLALVAPASSLVSYALTYPSANEIAVTTSINFAPTTLSPNAQRIGVHLSAIQAAGGSSSMAPYIAALFTQPDDASLNTMYEKLGPGAMGSLSALSTTSSQGFNDAMHSCRQREGNYRFIREGECSWMRLGGSRHDQERSELNPGYEQDSFTMAGGFQKEVNANVHLGFGLSYQQSALNSIYSDVNGQRFEGGVILKHRADATRVSLSFSAAYGSYESRRLVDIANPGVHAEGKPKLWSTSLHGRISHDVMSSDNAYVRPMLGLGVSYISRNAYTESGAGGANLHVAKEDDTLVSLHPAVEFGGERSIGDEGTLLRHYLRVGMTQLLGSNEQNVTASLEGAPSGVAPFTVSTRSDKTYADLVFGVDILRKSGTTVRLEYSGQFSNHSTANAIGIKVAMPF